MRKPIILEDEKEKAIYLKLDIDVYKDLKQIVEENGTTVKHFVGKLIKSNVQAMKFSKGE